MFIELELKCNAWDCQIEWAFNQALKSKAPDQHLANSTESAQTDRNYYLAQKQLSENKVKANAKNSG